MFYVYMLWTFYVRFTYPYHGYDTVAMIVCKQISSYSFKNEVTYILVPYQSYMDIHLNVCKQMTDFKLLLFYRNTWNHLNVCKWMRNVE